MSTNVYWVDRPCCLCERSDRIHVYKSTWRNGGPFKTWQGFGRYSPDVPDGFPISIRSVQEWIDAVASRAGHFEDEYHEEIPFEEVFAQTDNHSQGAIEYARDQGLKYSDMWLDPKGNLFCGVWFS